MGRQQWRLVSDVAQVVACYLRCHPRVEAVRYPGLKEDPLFKKASCTLVGGFGPCVWYCVAGEWRELVCEAGDARELVLSLEHIMSKDLSPLLPSPLMPSREACEDEAGAHDHGAVP